MSKNLNRGYAIAEILIGSAVVTIVLFVMLGASRGALVLARENSRSAQAAFLLEEGFEIIRVIRDRGWNENIVPIADGIQRNFVFESSVSYPDGNWHATTSQYINSNFVRTVTVEPVTRDANSDISSSGTDDPGTKKVTVEVSWVGGNNSTTSRSMSGYITDFLID